MSRVEKIEADVTALSPSELAAFRRWFIAYDGSHWDRQIEDDITAGRLDGLADEALADLREGRCTDL